MYTTPESSQPPVTKSELAKYVGLPALLSIGFFEVLKRVTADSAGSEIPEVLLAAFTAGMGAAVLAAERYARNNRQSADQNTKDQSL